ncbi:acyltransferase [Halotia branconii]|uniref:Acyltransferase n=1 Tax=Halotia branconii CENA392 TaxID=1539056 RepID=A0AAJ6NW61_9CYAN|nr:acyltransferase [Halotia branconii]WGV27608.1 acyltransferase [Halotia branconii CENA392]
MVAVLVALLPSKLKILVLKMMGHEIGKNVYIGMSILNIKKITLKDDVRIKNFNYLKNLSHLTMMEKSAIDGSFNWFTASKTHDYGQEGFGCITIGERTRILSRHYLDLQEQIIIGKKCLIAGSSSSFYTHTIIADPDYRETNKPIIIGDYCYIASHCILLPGAGIGSFTLVGAGSVITKNFLDKNYVLVAGNPANVKKSYPKDAKFFTNNVKPREVKLEKSEASLNQK